MSTTDPRDHSATRQPTWRNVFAAYGLLAAVPLALWAMTNPLAGGVVLAGIAAVAIGTRRVVELVRWFYDCGEFALEPVDAVRLTGTNRTAGTGDADECGTEATLTSSCC